MKLGDLGESKIEENIFAINAYPFRLHVNGRDDWIRTSDLTHPKGARYQASLRPDRLLLICRSLGDQGYHRPSRSVKKARSVSRRSSNILRLRSCGASSAGATPELVPLSGSPPACSRRWRLAPAMVN